MKKGLLAVILTALILLPCIAGAEGINVMVDDIAIDFNDASPVIVEGRTLVPLRGVFEELGAVVEWDADTRTAAVNYKLLYRITVTPGSYIMRVKSMKAREIELDVPAQIVGDRMMLPLRAVSEALGCDVSWEQDTRTVRIGRISDGVIDTAQQKTVTLDNGKQLSISVMSSQFKEDEGVKAQMNTILKQFADRLFADYGADILPQEVFAAEENILEYAEALFYDNNGDICLYEALSAGSKDMLSTYLFNITAFDAQTGEIKYAQNLTEHDES